MTTPTVAITGLGVVAPCGVGVDAFWNGLLAAPPPGNRRAVPDWDPSPVVQQPQGGPPG